MSSGVGATVQASTAQVTNIEALLAPISGDHPAGESLQYSGLYDEIRKARRSEVELEKKFSDWKEIVRLATEALSSKTKDLQVCAWLTEALVKLHGFSGLREGLQLMRGLHERFWESVYPEIDGGDLVARGNSLAWMDRQLALAVQELPLTQSVEGVSYSFFRYEQSKEFDIPDNLEGLDSAAAERLNALKDQAVRENKTTSLLWRKAKGVTPLGFYEELYLLLNECWEEFRRLDKVMDEKYDRQTPGLGALKKALDEIRTLVEKLVREKRPLEPDRPTEHPEKGLVQGNRTDSRTEFPTENGPIRGRQDALKRLGEVANFFLKTEPHSPVSYLINRAVKWGQMPLETWLTDVIKDGATLEHLRETLGFKTRSEGE